MDKTKIKYTFYIILLVTYLGLGVSVYVLADQLKKSREKYDELIEQALDNNSSKQLLEEQKQKQKNIDSLLNSIDAALERHYGKINQIMHEYEKEHINVDSVWSYTDQFNYWTNRFNKFDSIERSNRDHSDR